MRPEPDRRQRGRQGPIADATRIAKRLVASILGLARERAPGLTRRLAGFGVSLVLGFVAGLLALYAFAEVADEVAENEARAIDLAVYDWLQRFRSPALDDVMQAISTIGGIGVVVLFVALLVYFGRRRRWPAALALALVTGGAYLLNTVLKAIFQRTRPTPVEIPLWAQVYSFPSGHAMISAAFYLFLAYLGWRLLRGWARVVSVVALVMVVLAIGISRLYLGVHFLTDVVAGYLAGFFWVDAVVIGVRLLAGPTGESGPRPSEPAPSDSGGEGDGPPPDEPT